MTEVNPKNARLIVEWTEELEEEYSDSTVDQKLAALAHYETATAFANFTDFDREKARCFVESILAKDVLSRTRVSSVRHVKSFFEWMVMAGKIPGKQARPPLKSLKLPKKSRRAGQAARRVKFATVEQITATLLAMPKTNAVERRNRALIAFTLLSGARDGAIISMRVGNVDLAGKEVLQHPDEVDTKASKQIHTWFFPVGDVIENEVADYIVFLRDDLEYTDQDPLFPATFVGQDENDRFVSAGLSKKRWASAQSMRDIFKAAFKANGLPYFNPHSFRNTLMALAYEMKLPPDEIKAWSQNLGHEKLDTSFNSYGNLSPERQRVAILGLHDRLKVVKGSNADTIAQIKALAASL